MPDTTDEFPTPNTVDLSPLETAVLKVLRSRSGPIAEEEVSAAAGLSPEEVRGSLQRLRSKRLAVVEEIHEATLRPTPRGESALSQGLPERRLLDALRSQGIGLEEALPEEERSAAIGNLRRLGYLEPGMPLRLRPDAPPGEGELPQEATLRRIAQGTIAHDAASVRALERRGLVRTDHTTRRRWAPSEVGATWPIEEAGERIGPLRGEMLASGAWKTGSFRPYDVRAEVPFVFGARPHPYPSWLEEFEEILIGLGFEQAEGPLVETEFWNADVLFMPQDHPSRSIHDVLHLTGIEGRLPEGPVADRVAAVHEGRPLPGSTKLLSLGWTQSYDPRIAARSVLRSQTTAVSGRYLARAPEPPFRMYSIDRNFRFEALDASHHIEFGQCEGVVGQEGISIRHLIGVFQSLAKAIGIGEVRVRPSYFPFTEPSVEGYVKHPRLGWIEVFPGGLFRPEVLRPLGIEVPVAAWGIGVTRLAMVALGCNDIRELFQDDLGRLREGRV
ncbi:MAG: phenylalanine--tRNA ligase subunit alpha [Candidatus Thermoplasmatota archaeon]|nr:phenylalanine--tRNA ligase subunit alpha [Candidatus Thermoplasmatota archaeon]